MASCLSKSTSIQCKTVSAYEKSQGKSVDNVVDAFFSQNHFVIAPDAAQFLSPYGKYIKGGSTQGVQTIPERVSLCWDCMRECSLWSAPNPCPYQNYFTTMAVFEINEIYEEYTKPDCDSCPHRSLCKGEFTKSYSKPRSITVHDIRMGDYPTEIVVKRFDYWAGQHDKMRCRVRALPLQAFFRSELTVRLMQACIYQYNYVRKPSLLAEGYGISESAVKKICTDYVSLVKEKGNQLRYAEMDTYGYTRFLETSIGGKSWHLSFYTPINSTSVSDSHLIGAYPQADMKLFEAMVSPCAEAKTCGEWPQIEKSEWIALAFDYAAAHPELVAVPPAFLAHVMSIVASLKKKDPFELKSRVDQLLYETINDGYLTSFISELYYLQLWAPFQEDALALFEILRHVDPDIEKKDDCMLSQYFPRYLNTDHKAPNIHMFSEYLFHHFESADCPQEEIRERLLFLNEAVMPLEFTKEGYIFPPVDNNGDWDLSSIKIPGIRFPCLVHLLEHSLLSSEDCHEAFCKAHHSCCSPDFSSEECVAVLFGEKTCPCDSIHHAKEDELP